MRSIARNADRGISKLAGRELNQAIRRATASDLNANTEAALDNVNQTLMQVERNWCNPAGIPGRPWFKHSIYATRFTYAHLELPGLTEAAEAGNWTRAAAQAEILKDELAKNTATLQQAIDATQFRHRDGETMKRAKLVSLACACWSVS